MAPSTATLLFTCSIKWPEKIYGSSTGQEVQAFTNASARKLWASPNGAYPRLIGSTDTKI